MQQEYRTIARGKPADYGQEIVKRRFRLTMDWIDLTNKVALDFGCGNGAQTAQFMNCGAIIHAIDIDDDNIKLFREVLTRNNITTIYPKTYDGAIIPFESSSIDIVLTYEVLEHVEDESETLKEIYRVLNSKGEMIISVPNKGWVFETHGANLPMLPWNRVPFFSWLPYGLHRRYAKSRIYRKRDIIKLLEQHSFDVLKSCYITAPMDVVRNAAIRKFLRSTIFSGDTTNVSMFSTSILLHCKKR